MKKIVITAIVILIVSVAFFGCDKKKSTYEKGILTEKSFESKYLRMRFSLPAGYVMGTEEDLNRMMDIGADITGTSKLQIDYAKLTTVYEMMAMEPSGRSSVVIYSENPVLSGLTVAQYFDALKEGLFAQAALDYKLVNDVSSVRITEEDYEQMTFLLSNLGCYQSYSIRKLDSRFIGIIVTYYTEDQLDTLMNGFSAY